MIKIVLFDNQEMMKYAISSYFANQPEIEILSEVSTATEVLEIDESQDYDILLINSSTLKDLHKDVLRKFRQIKGKIILINSVEIPMQLLKYLPGLLGSISVYNKPVELKQAILNVFNGNNAFAPSLIHNLVNFTVNSMANDSMYFNLSEREKEILHQLSLGCSNREISENLFISEKTVKNHLSNIYKKLDVQDRTQAVVKALQHNLVQGSYLKIASI